MLLGLQSMGRLLLAGPCLLSPYSPGCHGRQWPWSRASPRQKTRHWHYTLVLRQPLRNREHQTPAVDSCVARENAAAYQITQNYVVWFLWATKWRQRTGVSYDCCDLSSVSYFLCSWGDKEYLTIKGSSTG